MIKMDDRDTNPWFALQSKGEVSSFPAAHLAIFQATVASFIDV